MSPFHLANMVCFDAGSPELGYDEFEQVAHSAYQTASGFHDLCGGKLLMIPGDASIKATQLLAGDPPQDRIGEVVDLFVRREADLWMGLELDRKPCGSASWCADADKVDLVICDASGKFSKARVVVAFVSQEIRLAPLVQGAKRA